MGEFRIHRPVRRLWSPWRRRCACGIDRWPCWDMDPPTADTAGGRSTRLDRWNDPTRNVPALNRSPLLTPGQAWRTRQGGRW